jgi:hypothetical protein
MSPIELTDKLAKTHCANGANIYVRSLTLSVCSWLTETEQYERNVMGVSHSSEALMGFPGAFVWLTAIHNGDAVMPGCSTSRISESSLVGLLDGTLGRGLWDAIIAMLGVPISG